MGLIFKNKKIDKFNKKSKMNYYRNKYKIGKILESSMGQTLGYHNDYSDYINAIFEFCDPNIVKCGDCNKVVIGDFQTCIVDGCNKNICCSPECVRCKNKTNICRTHKNYFQDMYKSHIFNGRRMVHRLCQDCIIQAIDRERIIQQQRELRLRISQEATERRMQNQRTRRRDYQRRSEETRDRLLEEGAVLTGGGDIMFCRNCWNNVQTENPPPYTYFCNQQCYNIYRGF